MRVQNIIGLFIILIMLFSCNAQKDENKAYLTGKVYSQNTEGVVTPMDNVLLTVRNFYTQSYTDGNGGFEISIELDAEEQQVVLQASKAGYSLAEANVMVKKTETTIVPDIIMLLTSSGGSGSPLDTISTSGDAAHIEVIGEYEPHIYIQSSGLRESAVISFLVTDEKGVPVDKDHKVTVNFSILNGPDGGEYLFPEEMETYNGKVFTILNSGIIAGAVQILAEVEVGGKTIRMMPIRMAIYGGLPDKEHFSVALEKVNIAGQVRFGLIDYVTAFVGDKYSNPVAPGTAVYFRSDYCIVEGAAVTDELGRAVVRFISASPLPPNPPVNPFAEIEAVTYTDTLVKKEITTTANLLLSGPTAAIQVNPTNFQFSNTLPSVSFDYTVTDIWGYPLVGDTRIQVTTTAGILYGDTDIRLVDTQTSGQGTTEFSFVWAPEEQMIENQIFISITVDPQKDGNGYRSVQIGGIRVSN